jgi:hypothetical protein
MDHLQTDEERKDRWYAKHLEPRYVPVEPALSWQDLYHHDGTYSLVRSLPFSWLATSTSDDTTCTGNEASLLQENIYRELDEHGFVVVSDVLDRRDCAAAMEQAWDWMEAASQAELAYRQQKQSDDYARADSSTVERSDSPQTTAPPPVTVTRNDLSTLSSIYFPRSVEGGVLPFYGSGHSSFAWTIRSHPRVKRVFEAVHGGKSDLISSLDGIILWRSGSEVCFAAIA